MIRKVYIHNFRCLENFTFDLGDKKSALIIGKNASGKSTFRDALKILQSIARGTLRVKHFLRLSDVGYHRLHIPVTFEVECKLDERVYNYRISFEYPHRFEEVRISTESLRVDQELIFSREGTQVLLADGAQFLLDSQICGLSIINPKTGLNNIDRLNQFLAYMFLLSPIPASVTSYSDDETLYLDQDSNNLVSFLRSVLSRYPKAYQELDSYIKNVFPDFESIRTVPKGEIGKLYQVVFRQQDSGADLKVDFASLSDGEKMFFLSGVILALSKMNEPVFCFWDEPDNHLSLSEIGQFIVELRKMKNFRGQFVATSHHPKTIQRFSDENTYLFERHSHFAPTKVTLLSEKKYNGNLIDALTKDEILT
jgi:predicted ATPase